MNSVKLHSGQTKQFSCQKRKIIVLGNEQFSLLRKHVFFIVPVRKSSYPVSKHIIVQLSYCLQSPLYNKKVILKGKEVMTIISYSLLFQDPLSHLHCAYFINVCKIESLNTTFISVYFIGSGVFQQPLVPFSARWLCHSCSKMTFHLSTVLRQLRSTRGRNK